VEERYQSELDHSEKVLDDVDRALVRLSEGSYESCERCGAHISDTELEADPTLRLCVRCSGG
jgi:DnaK suppressor protein